jgi:hypothetical protein
MQYIYLPTKHKISEFIVLFKSKTRFALFKKDGTKNITIVQRITIIKVIIYGFINTLFWRNSTSFLNKCSNKDKNGIVDKKKKNRRKVEELT